MPIEVHTVSGHLGGDCEVIGRWASTSLDTSGAVQIQQRSVYGGSSADAIGSWPAAGLLACWPLERVSYVYTLCMHGSKWSREQPPGTAQTADEDGL